MDIFVREDQSNVRYALESRALCFSHESCRNA